uniref:Uncharacterized protein n=1 Tax=Crocodylus porosus TaxID=8502 RepID=A0A7M4EYZ8_CROPO
MNTQKVTKRTVLPLAHISNDKKQITLINPQAVNLDAYKEKLEQAVKSYEWRLNLITWRALSQEERDKFEQDKPVRYMEHKEALLESLENLGWPVSYEDVMLLEDEILAGLTYIQQASDLQEAAKKDIQRTSASPVNHSKKVGSIGAIKYIALERWSKIFFRDFSSCLSVIIFSVTWLFDKSVITLCTLEEMHVS